MPVPKDLPVRQALKVLPVRSAPLVPKALPERLVPSVLRALQVKSAPLALRAQQAGCLAMLTSMP